MNRDLAGEHRATNALHTLLLLGAMGAVLLIVGSLTPLGAVMTALLGLVLLWMSRRAVPSFVLRLYRARPLRRDELVELQEMVAWLSRRAGLPAIPRLYYVPSKIMNAFTVGDRDDAAIGVTDGLLRALSPRELTGVLAHEVSHVRHNDMRVMTLADMVSRLASTLQTLALFIAVFNMLGGMAVSWYLVVALILAPSLMTMLQLALSRTREFDADLGALELTGDAVGLASALEKMERYQQSFLDRVFMPGRRIPDPSALRSHPATQERVKRLLEIGGVREVRVDRPVVPTAGFHLPSAMPTVERGPRLHVTGLWF